MAIDVLKFGGSSVANIKNLECVKKIANKWGNKIIVVSAFGKTEVSDTKLTDLLIDCSQAVCLQDFDNAFRKVEQKILEISYALKTKLDVKNCLKNIRKKYIKSKDAAYLISRGEYMTAKILAEYLCLPFVDAKNIMIFENGKPNYIKIEKILKKITKKHKKIIIPGFYATENNKLFIFSRGGSDISGAIIARAVRAKNYYNFTDVDGVYNVSPKIIQTKTNIKKISYEDLDKITQNGAEVIHNDCIQILNKQNTKLKICNTNKLGKGGTCVCKVAKPVWFISNYELYFFVKTRNAQDRQKIKKLPYYYQEKQDGFEIQKTANEKIQLKTIIKVFV